MNPEEIMEQKIIALEARVYAVETAQAAHIQTTTEVKKDTTEIIELFQSLKGFWKVLEFIGKLSKPIAVVGTIFAAWFAIKGVTK